jgi:hypothetical protein
MDDAVKEIVRTEMRIVFSDALEMAQTNNNLDEIADFVWDHVDKLSLDTNYGVSTEMIQKLKNLVLNNIIMFFARK